MESVKPSSNVKELLHTGGTLNILLDEREKICAGTLWARLWEQSGGETCANISKVCVIPVWQETQAGRVFGRCLVGLSLQVVVVEAAAAAAADAAGTMRRQAAERQRSEEPVVEPPGAQTATFTYKKQPNLTFQHVSHPEKSPLVSLSKFS